MNGPLWRRRPDGIRPQQDRADDSATLTTDPGVRVENDELRATLRDVRRELMAAKTSLGAERGRNRQLTDQVRAARALVAAAERQCAETCPHARVAAEQRVQLSVMQERLSALQAANERRDVVEYSPGWTPRRIPKGQQ